MSRSHPSQRPVTNINSPANWYMSPVMSVPLHPMTTSILPTEIAPTSRKQSHYLDALMDVHGWQHAAYYLPQTLQPEEIEGLSPTSNHSGPMHTNQDQNDAARPLSPPSRGNTKSRHQSERRKAQNRQSQRAYRERKEQQLQDVTSRLEELDRKLEDEQTRRQLAEEALAGSEAKLVDSEARNRLLQQQLTTAKSRNEEMRSRWQLLMSKFKQHASESQVRRCCPDKPIGRDESPVLSPPTTKPEPQTIDG